MSPIQNTNPDVRQRSFHDRQIFLCCQGGTEGIFRCDELRYGCRTFRQQPIFHAASREWCVVRAMRMPDHGNFRNSRLPKLQMRAHVVLAWWKACGTPNTSAIPPLWFQVSECGLC